MESRIYSNNKYSSPRGGCFSSSKGRAGSPGAGAFLQGRQLLPGRSVLGRLFLVRLVLGRLVLGLLLALGTLSCELPIPPEAGTLRLVSWNAQNLFDDLDQGSEYPEFRVEEGDWSRERLWHRLGRLALVLEDLCPGGPDVLALQEVENLRVLEILREHFFPLYGYGPPLLVEEGLAVHTGLLTRLPVQALHLHRPESQGEQPLRSLLEVVLESPLGPLHVINNHWKSRNPSAEETKSARQAASRVLERRVRDILENDPGARILALGDFNTYPEISEWEALPYSLANMEGLMVDLWTQSTEAGTYHFRGEWFRLDHILVSPALLPRVQRFERGLHPELLNDQGQPRPWSSRDPGGISDHLPLILELSP